MASRGRKGRFSKPPITRAAATIEGTGPQGIRPRGSYVATENFEIVTQCSYMYANGGSWKNPMGFPGYDERYSGSYDVYDWMLQHPVIQLVRSIDVGIIASNTWEVARRKFGSEVVNDKQLARVQDAMDQIRHSLIWDFFVPGRDKGWSPAELMWQYVDGWLVPTDPKPLSRRSTEVIVDKGGNSIGLRNYSPKSPTDTKVDLPFPYKGWKYTHDQQGQDPYGRPWLENVRETAWKGWMDCAQKLKRLGAKITGVVTIITSPAGTFPGPKDPVTGIPKQISYKENADRAIEAMAKGVAGLWFPSLGLTPNATGSIDAMKVLAQLAGKSLTNIEVVDFSGNATAMPPLLEEMKHYEELMFNGGHRSARTGLEGSHGTQAEAGVHTDTGTVNAEAEDVKFAKAIQPILDAIVAVNISEAAVGKLYIRPPSLIERQSTVLKAIFLALMNNSDFAASWAESEGDIAQMGRLMNIPGTNKFKMVRSKPSGTQSNVQNPNPQGGRPAQE